MMALVAGGVGVRICIKGSTGVGVGGGGGYQVAGRLVVRNNENQTFVR